MKYMENTANRFWLYLLGKKRKIITKKEIKDSYNDFQKLWGKKKVDFVKVFDTLRKSRLKYIFKKNWYVLSQEEFDDLKNNKFDEYEIILSFLKEEGVPYYLGLSTAKYLNKITWQSLNVVYIINTRFKIKRKIGNLEIRLIKFPKDLIVKIALFKSDKEIFYSDIEKTFLDETYYKLYKKGKTQIMDYEFNELDMEKIKAYLAFYSKYPQVKKEVIKKLNKKQTNAL